MGVVGNQAIAMLGQIQPDNSKTLPITTYWTAEIIPPHDGLCMLMRRCPEQETLRNAPAQPSCEFLLNSRRHNSLEVLEQRRPLNTMQRLIEVLVEHQLGRGGRAWRKARDERAEAKGAASSEVLILGSWSHSSASCACEDVASWERRLRRIVFVSTVSALAKIYAAVRNENA